MKFSSGERTIIDSINTVYFAISLVKNGRSGYIDGNAFSQDVQS
jgi:hypothetical protein